MSMATGVRKSTVFLENLPWPTAVVLLQRRRAGRRVSDIIFAKDTNGDGVADEKKVLFTGFGTKERLNVQGLFNNFIWEWTIASTGARAVGGMVRQAAHPRLNPSTSQQGLGYRPADTSMTTESGGGQYGLSFDHLDRLFTCSTVFTSRHSCSMRCTPRNAFTPPDPRICIAADGRRRRCIASRPRAVA
jgi:hypothetical protein